MQQFIEGVRRLCDEKDILLILDEIQCGMAMISWPACPSLVYAYFFAALMAPSMASVPLFVKKIRSIPLAFSAFFAASMVGTL